MSAPASEIERIAGIAKALGHPTRVQIVELLARQAECRGADVFGELPLAQSTISEHLKVLREAGIVDSSPDGPAMVYCLAPEALSAVASFVSRILEERACCTSSGACSTGGC
ncbi:MAG TPA: metalloregulator ArsR/SmtB family transcription factor [Coriobacteriia bacterium]|nr:metalloregulator ArsR/SmtB family transcription factor [Coriobacteriia bacterium]